MEGDFYLTHFSNTAGTSPPLLLALIVQPTTKVIYDPILHILIQIDTIKVFIFVIDPIECLLDVFALRALYLLVSVVEQRWRSCSLLRWW